MNYWYGSGMDDPFKAETAKVQLDDSPMTEWLSRANILVGGCATGEPLNSLKVDSIRMTGYNILATTIYEA